MNIDKNRSSLPDAHKQPATSLTSSTAASNISTFPEEVEGEEEHPPTPPRIFKKKALLINVHWKVRRRATPVVFPLQDNFPGNALQRIKTKPEERTWNILNALRRSHHDVRSVRQLLIDAYKYAPEDIVTLIDNDNPEQKQPTEENMLNEIEKLLEDAEEHDRLFFYFSGHSDQRDTDDIKELDGGKDEFILTSDGEKIKDYELRAKLAKPLPVGSRLTAIFDSCHSGTMWDPKIKTDTLRDANRRNQVCASFSRHSASVLAGSQGAVINGGTFIATNSLHVDSAGNLLPYTLLAFQTTLGAIHTHSNCPAIETQKPPPLDLVVPYRTSLPIYYEDLPILFSPLVFMYLWSLIFGHHSLNLNTG